jgi:hypothetical protein
MKYVPAIVFFAAASVLAVLTMVFGWELPFNYPFGW